MDRDKIRGDIRYRRDRDPTEVHAEREVHAEFLLKWYSCTTDIETKVESYQGNQQDDHND